MYPGDYNLEGMKHPFVVDQYMDFRIPTTLIK